MLIERSLSELPILLTDISNTKEENQMAYSTSTTLDEPDVRQYQNRQRDRRIRRHCSGHHECYRSRETRKRTNSVFGRKVLILARKHYPKAVHYSPNRPLYKSSRYDDDVASGVQRMQR